MLLPNTFFLIIYLVDVKKIEQDKHQYRLMSVKNPSTNSKKIDVLKSSFAFHSIEKVIKCIGIKQTIFIKMTIAENNLFSKI